MDECAELLRVSKGTLYVWVFQRKIPRIKLGKLNRFDRQTIDQMMKNNTIG